MPVREWLRAGSRPTSPRMTSSHGEFHGPPDAGAPHKTRRSFLLRGRSQLSELRLPEDTLGPVIAIEPTQPFG